MADLPFTVDELANAIRYIDGSHSMGAGALAEALMPFITNRLAALPKQEYAAPIAWMRYSNGMPDWGEDCLSAEPLDPEEYDETTLTWVPLCEYRSSWQPIDTAPRDGETQILLRERTSTFIGIRPIGCPLDAAADLHGIACYPSHWMPLPPPPTVDEREVES